MKSYLGLVSESAKAHKKKNRLTVICIAISVMLVTAIFGMADMSLRAQTEEAIRRYGNWHAIFTNISDITANAISGRNDVNISSWFGMAEATTYQGKELVVQSSSQELAEQMNMVVTEGHYPVAAQEALLDREGLEQFGLAIGDTIEISFLDGSVRQYAITGTFGDYSTLKGSDAHGLQLSTEGIRALPANLYKPYYYVQFDENVNINGAIADIKAKYHLSDEQVSTNVMLLGLMGQSSDTTMQEIYLTAGILFILVAMTGTFMIASSFNMSLLERTQFFGLLRCLGATKRQVKRYIRLEGLRYCAVAIPVGLLAGCGVLWAAMLVINQLNSPYLPAMPTFQVSWLGLAAGAILGVLVVMIASNSPAKRAARVSPQAAITGNLKQTNQHAVNKASNTRLFHVDTAMGIRHAFANKKSMVLIAGSFAISIVLFLCFTILITFMNHALNPLKPYAPDLSIEGVQDTVLLNRSLKQQISALPHIKNIYGRMFYTDIPARDKQGTNKATLVSYDEPQFAWAEDSLISGSIEDVKNGGGVLIDYGYSQEYNWRVGDTITLHLNGKAYEVQVAGIVSDVPLESAHGEWIILCSEDTFTALTGIEGYKIIDIQVEQDISDQVRSLITPDLKLLDFQQRNSEVRTGYFAMAVFVYGFLLVIALVALINIINTVNASVSSRMGSYGMMRAVGMSGKQLKKMVTAEAAAYAISGSLTGGILGLILHRFFFGMLITANWGELWQPPLAVLIVTISAAILTTFIAVISPTRKIENMSIVNVVNAE
ncbi:FtsX-like permease family protein [Paenibacillus sanguinis]|uniref:FtsX-like permease family protein n=1 Tax=Paenibacillus sanguinis TaxID=225906 RepID=UPI000365FB7C|nr:FtsX-like permease family protein [Paenibacillus sanguinis]